MQIDLAKTEAALQSGYRSSAVQYRKDDEIEIESIRHRRLSNLLSTISSSFGRMISVLDIGCGTGRYFHCLKNVDRLVGMDISPEMLAAARNPVQGHLVRARSIDLIQGNAFLTSFPAHSFDFIYSLGMFGHGCPVTIEVCNQFHSWLAPGGRLLFDVIDVAGLPLSRRIKRQARSLCYPVIPSVLKDMWDRRENHTPFFGLDRRELETLMRATRFSDFTVCSHICESPLWQGRHLECQAQVACNGK